MKQTTKEDIYGPLPFHEKNIPNPNEDIYGPLPVHEKNTPTPKEGGNDLDQIPLGEPHLGWRDFPIESLNFPLTVTNDSEDFDDQITNTTVLDPDEIEKWVEKNGKKKNQFLHQKKVRKLHSS